MSYLLGASLQRALYAALIADPELAERVGERVYDDFPEKVPPETFVLIGEETVEPWSTASDEGAIHVLRLGVVGSRRGVSSLKETAARACAVALGPLNLEGGRVAYSTFLGATTQGAGADGLRRVDIRVRVAVEFE